MSDRKGSFVPLDVNVNHYPTATDEPNKKIWIGVPVLLLVASAIALGAAGNNKADYGMGPKIGDYIDSVRLQAHMKFIGSGEITEGRAPGTRGEAVAAAYIKSQMEIMGLNPYIQPVPLIGTTTVDGGVSPMIFKSGPNTLSFDYLTDFVPTTDFSDVSNPIVVNPTELVYVGYGISAPEIGWDDWQGVDVTGKVVLCWVGQPPALGPAASWYGRWPYKVEIARAKKAAAVIQLHYNVTSGYAWPLVITTFTGEIVRLDTEITNPLPLRSWIRQEAVAQIAQMAGSTFETWLNQANKADFQPQVLAGITVEQTTRYTRRQFKGQNVVGIIEGDKSGKPEESIIYIGHLDHLGIKNGITYPGYLDNASGSSMVLTVAFAFSHFLRTHNIKPLRSVVFLCPTAEESGLLGTEYYIANPDSRVTTNNTVAAMAFDVGNAWGATKDLVPLGDDKSELGPLFWKHAAHFGMTISPDYIPSAGYWMRSDHFVYAKNGIPSIFVQQGLQFIGKPADYAQKVVLQGYMGSRYHQPTDAYDPNYNYDGMVQEMGVASSVGYELIMNTNLRPKCTNKGKCV